MADVAISRSILWRANLQRQLCPGRFSWMLHCSHGVWSIPKGFFKTTNFHLELAQALTELARKPLRGGGGFINVLEEMIDEDDCVLLRVDFLTKKLKFLDILKLWIPKKVEGETVEVCFFVESSGICPLVVPGAPLISTLLFWIPFQDDNQMTRREMEWLVLSFEQANGVTSSLVVNRRGKRT